MAGVLRPFSGKSLRINIAPEEGVDDRIFCFYLIRSVHATFNDYKLFSFSLIYGKFQKITIQIISHDVLCILD